MVTVGGMEGLYLTLLAILNRGDEVIIPAPYWINYVQMVCMCSGEPIITAPVSTNDLSISIENIRKAITPKTKAIILNTPSNPSGKIISDDSIQQIAQIAIDNDLIVITDEVYKTLLYDNAHFKSIVTCDKMKERTVVINSLSKEFCMTGWRLGYVAAPSELISAMTMFQENIAACAPLPSQYAAIEALRNSEKYSAGMIEEFTLRRNVLLEEVAKIKTITVDAPQGTFYAMLNIKSTGLKSEEFAYALLEKEQVAVVPGITYGDCCEDFIRIAFTLDIYKIKEGIQEKKGKKIVVADLTSIEDTICKYFVICQGNSPSQVSAIVDSIKEFTRKGADSKPYAIDGLRNAEWVAMDYADVLVHVFLPETRAFYNLEHLWADAKLTQIPDLD